MNTQVSLENYLKETKIPLRLAAQTPSGWPTVISLWYLFEDGCFFCATPRKAKIVSYVLAEPRCGLEVASDLPPYCGVRGPALAQIDENRGLEILEQLLYRYLGGIDNPLAQGLLNRTEPEAAIRLEPQNLYTWNFSKRMQNLLAQPGGKLCPA